MLVLIASALAAAVSWLGNRAALHFIGIKGIIVAGPLVEEAAKSGAAVLTGSSLVLTHGAFGLIEGIYDAWGGGAKAVPAALVSLFGHLFYGYVAYLTWRKQGVFWAAVLAGYVVHMLWNLTVLRFVVSKRRKTV